MATSSSPQLQKVHKYKLTKVTSSQIHLLLPSRLLHNLPTPRLLFNLLRALFKCWLLHVPPHNLLWNQLLLGLVLGFVNGPFLFLLPCLWCITIEGPPGLKVEDTLLKRLTRLRCIDKPPQGHLVRRLNNKDCVLMELQPSR